METKIFKNLEEYKNSGERCNGCSQQFLDEHKITLAEYSVINEGNSRCWNCWKCEGCSDCNDCDYCLNCVRCTDCKRCKECTDCIKCRSCASCTTNQVEYEENSFRNYEEFRDYLKDNHPLEYTGQVEYETKIFKNYEEFQEYLKNNPNDCCNGCSLEFLDTINYYGRLELIEEKNILEKYSELNKKARNSRCWNCWDCKDCDKCVNCKKCHDCYNCIGSRNEIMDHCDNCNECIDCKECKDCIECEGCYDCKECEECEKCYYCNRCNNCADCRYCVSETDYANVNDFINREFDKDKFNEFYTYNDFKESEETKGISREKYITGIKNGTQEYVVMINKRKNAIINKAQSKGISSDKIKEILEDKILEIKELNHCRDELYFKKESYSYQDIDEYNSEAKKIKPAERQYLMSISSNKDEEVLTTLKFLMSLLPSYEELVFKNYKLSLIAYAANKRIKKIIDNIKTKYCSDPEFLSKINIILKKYNVICIRIAEEIPKFEKDYEQEVKKYEQEKENYEQEVKKYEQEKENYEQEEKKYEQEKEKHNKNIIIFYAVLLLNLILAFTIKHYGFIFVLIGILLFIAKKKEKILPKPSKPCKPSSDKIRYEPQKPSTMKLDVIKTLSKEFKKIEL